jgi:hypothetical protein
MAEARCPRCGRVVRDSDCGSCLIDLEYLEQQAQADYGGAFDGFTVTSDADEGL